LPVDKFPLDSRLLVQVVKLRWVSLTNDYSARVEASEIEAANVTACGIENDDKEEQRSGKSNRDSNFEARWRFDGRHWLMQQVAVGMAFGSPPV
jgi:hypothetical protein